MNNYWDISIGNKVITTNKFWPACPVELCGRKLGADMLILDTGGYNVIIGMTLLSKYHAVIDCRHRKVIFKIPHQPKFQFLGDCESSKKMKQIDYVIIEANKNGVPVWGEYPDVFEEISGVPPARVLEFNIDIIPGTSPISKAPYQMAPTELAILKEQLKDYLDKGLIRPSTLP